MGEKHNIFYTIILFFLLFLFFFGIFSWKIIWENIVIFGNLDKNNVIVRYNIARQLAKEGNFTGSLAMLPNEISGYNDRIHELRGDILYAQNSHKDAILQEYETSLQIHENERIHKKISLIKEKKKESMDNQNAIDNQDNNVFALQEILQEQEKRGEFLNSARILEGNFQRSSQYMKEFLGSQEGGDIKDW